MKRLFSYLLLAIVGSSFMFCTDSGTGSEEKEEVELTEGLIGSWSATSVQYINTADTTIKADLSQYIAVTVSVEDDSSYSFVTTVFGQPVSDTGVITANGDQIQFTSSLGDDKAGVYSIIEYNMSLVLNNQLFDFDQDGTDEDAILDVQLEKVN